MLLEQISRFARAKIDNVHPKAHGCCLGYSADINESERETNRSFKAEHSQLNESVIGRLDWCFGLCSRLREALGGLRLVLD